MLLSPLDTSHRQSRDDEQMSRRHEQHRLSVVERREVGVHYFIRWTSAGLRP